MSWDPIGVGDAPGAWDEYDAYISPLLHQLHRGASAEDITGYLVRLVEDRLEIPAQPVRERVFAKELVDWWARTTHV
jgi:hypothetical protein